MPFLSNLMSNLTSLFFKPFLFSFFFSGFRSRTRWLTDKRILCCILNDHRQQEFLCFPCFIVCSSLQVKDFRQKLTWIQLRFAPFFIPEVVYNYRPATWITLNKKNAKTSVKIRTIVIVRANGFFLIHKPINWTPLQQSAVWKTAFS